MANPTGPDGQPAELSRLQRFFKRWMRAETFEKHKAQSEKWIATCPNCGHRRNVWELGGMRGGSTGNPATRLKCPQCGQTGWHQVRYEG